MVCFALASTVYHSFQARDTVTRLHCSRLARAERYLGLKLCRDTRFMYKINMPGMMWKD